MGISAGLLAEKIRAMDAVQSGSSIEPRQSTQIIEGIGDIVAMLKLPTNSPLYPKETVTIRPVFDLQASDGLQTSAPRF